jgi:hypothetical protein
MRNIKELAEEPDILLGSILDFHYQGGCVDSRLALCLSRLRDAMAIEIYEIE